MLELEIDGKQLQVRDGVSVIEAAHSAGIHIPHFCYHKKLSIAASCRMCLVQVEKAPKPMPACATIVTNGMKVFTHSDIAVKAQKDVMEFLLINHPLDCPICDQGGECQLQDVSMGYGGTTTRYHEEKRVVPNKNLGPLVATDMTRCINCTRCVRFTQEIAGNMELGQAFRGDRAEIMSFLDRTLDSELSGNVIDLCPVGALTSKPFRYSARAWEMARRKSVSPHDGLGSNLIVQTRQDKLLRVLPLENEAINECWLSDKDRFSYEALNSAERLTKPMLKQGGQWQEVEWNIALDYASHALRDVARNHGADQIGALVSPHSTLEEMFLAGKLLRGMGSDNIDFRLRQSDFSLDGQQGGRLGTPWLGMKIAEIGELDRVLVVGSFLRKDHPLIAQRLRQSAKRGAQVSVIHAADEDLCLKLFDKAVVPPSQLPITLAGLLKTIARIKNLAPPADLEKVDDGKTGKLIEKIAESLVSGQKVGIFLGNFAQQHPQAASLHRLAAQIAGLLGGNLGFLGEAANSVGGYVAQACPQTTGRHAAALIADPRRAYLVLGAEPELDCADGAAALAALRQAASVVVLTPFKSDTMLDYADCLLPVAPFTETSGTFVNTEGRVQGFHAAAKAPGEVRPAWKVLRVLGNLLELPGFDYTGSEEILAEVLGGQPEFVSGLDNGLSPGTLNLSCDKGGLERIADVPIHFADPLARRSPSLQATRDAAAPTVRMNAVTLAASGFVPGEKVKVDGHGTGQGAMLTLTLDAGVPDHCVRIAAAHPGTIHVGALFGPITLGKA